MNIDAAGLVDEALFKASPNCDERPSDTAIELLVIHNISLPPGVFDGPAVTDLFLNRLDPAGHPYFATIAGTWYPRIFSSAATALCCNSCPACCGRGMPGSRCGAGASAAMIIRSASNSKVRMTWRSATPSMNGWVRSPVPSTPDIRSPPVSGTPTLRRDARPIRGRILTGHGIGRACSRRKTDNKPGCRTTSGCIPLQSVDLPHPLHHGAAAPVYCCSIYVQ